MRQRLHHRLHILEIADAYHRELRDWQEQEQASADGVIRKVELFLRLCGVVQTDMESLMEALARALEITPRELRAQIVAEIDPIHKYFEDRGVFEEIERRKAAGTWPSGSEKEREDVSA